MNAGEAVSSVSTMNVSSLGLRSSLSGSRQVLQWFSTGQSGKMAENWKKVVRKGGQKLTAKQIVLVDLLKQTPTISRKDISKKLGINESAVQKRLDTLRKKGVVSRVGPDRGGYWEVFEKGR